MRSATDPRAEADLWKRRYQEERERLGKLWVAYKDLEARFEARPAGSPPDPGARTPDATPDAPAGDPAGAKTVPTRIVDATQARPIRLPAGLYRMNQVPGLPARHLKGLADAGIHLTDELVRADLAGLSDTTGIPRDRLERHRAVCELMGLSGVGGKWATLLVDAGVTGIHDLSDQDAAAVTALMLRSYERQGMGDKRRIVLERTLPARVEKLVQQARHAVQTA